MIRKLTLAGALTLALIATVGPSPARAITGGLSTDVPYSFMGSLQRLDSPRPDLHVCGVELIAPRWALTAAHCTRSSADTYGKATTGRPYDWKVRFGSAQLGSGGRLVRVTRFTQLNNRYFHDDLALLRLARPVHLTPIRIADAPPAPDTPVRILGWGATCMSSIAPRCIPEQLHVAATIVQPRETCDPGAGNFCVGSRDGAVAPQNFDSGGPAIVIEDGEWRLVGTVEGGGGKAPAIYTDVVSHRDWVERHLDGRASIPTDTPFPSDALDGTVRLGGCSGSIIRTRQSRPSAPAMMLTAGHCLQPMPRPGAAVIGRSYRQYAYVENRHGVTVLRAATTDVLYGTMTGTDVAVLRLDVTYADLARAHVHTFELARQGPTPGQSLRVLSGNSGVAWNCRVQAIVPELLEGGYRTFDAIRYRTQKGCQGQTGDGPSHGDSGAPLVDASSGLIVGLHGTSNDEGKRCTADNPCEIDSPGARTSIERRKYGEQTAVLVPCLTGDSRLVESRPGCALTKHGAARDEGAGG